MCCPLVGFHLMLLILTRANVGGGGGRAGVGGGGGGETRRGGRERGGGVGEDGELSPSPPLSPDQALTTFAIIVFLPPQQCRSITNLLSSQLTQQYTSIPNVVFPSLNFKGANEHTIRLFLSICRSPLTQG